VPTSRCHKYSPCQNKLCGTVCTNELSSICTCSRNYCNRNTYKTFERHTRTHRGLLCNVTLALRNLRRYSYKTLTGSYGYMLQMHLPASLLQTSKQLITLQRYVFSLAFPPFIIHLPCHLLYVAIKPYSLVLNIPIFMRVCSPCKTIPLAVII